MAYTLSKQQVIDIEDSLKDTCGVNGASFRANYSGRGMYGKTCFGVDLDSLNDLPLLAVAMAEVLGAEDAVDILLHTTTDSMGHGIIAYWPGVTVEGALDEDEDEDEDEEN